ncbi:hypothetical protein HC928_23495 [bacterium]|nr:hypothetical protein [bacterium]
MKKRKKSDLYTERQTVSFTPEQMRRLRELRSVRARKDGRLIHITDLVRDAVNYYLAAQEDLPGSRRAIAKALRRRLTHWIRRSRLYRRRWMTSSTG